MPNLLNFVIKNGVKGVRKEALDAIFKGSKKKLYRYEEEPLEGLMKRGFDKSYTTDNISSYQPKGVYYGTNPESVEVLTGGASTGKNLIEALPRPGSKISARQSAIEGYDWVKGFDVTESTPGEPLKRIGDEVIQLKPNNALARVKSNNDWIYKIIGAGGVGVGGSMMADEAEASPIGNVIKNAAKKVVGGVESSTAKRLIGTEFKGQKITKVTKGAQNWRYIHLDDDTAYPVTKDVLHDLSRKAGTDDYLGRLAVKDEPSKLVQALKSLDYHRARSIPAGSKMMMREYYKQWTAQLKEAGLPNVPTCMVRSGKDTFLMPTEYAEMLEKEGHLKILKRLQ